MYTLLKELYKEYCGNPEYNIAILGLEKTGKTVFHLQFTANPQITQRYQWILLSRTQTRVQTNRRPQ